MSIFSAKKQLSVSDLARAIYLLIIIIMYTEYKRDRNRNSQFGILLGFS